MEAELRNGRVCGVCLRADDETVHEMRYGMVYLSMLPILVLGGGNAAGLAPADTIDRLAFASEVFHGIAITYPNMIPAPTAIAKNCVTMP